MIHDSVGHYVSLYDFFTYLQNKNNTLASFKRGCYLIALHFKLRNLFLKVLHYNNQVF